MGKRLYICSDHGIHHHCSAVCLHGMKPHFPDECTKLEFCEFAGKKVKCKPALKKLIKMYEENRNNEY